MDRKERLRQNRHLLFPHTYAEHVSQGSSERWVPYKHLVHASIEVARAIHRGNGRLIFSMPPRMGKSEFGFHWLPTWFLDLFPQKHVMGIGGDAGLAVDFARKVRDEFTLNPYTTTRIRGDTTAASKWLTTQGGGMQAFGALSNIMGRGGDLIILDDLVTSWQHARSKDRQKLLRDFIEGPVMSRLAPGGTVVSIMQRWHEGDPTGWLLKEFPGVWTEIKFPALATEHDILGRAPGDPLCPERYDLDAMIAKRDGMATSAWAALFQQNPIPDGGAIIGIDTVNYWSEMPRVEKVVQSWDLTFHENGTSYAVGQVWGLSRPNFYLLDQVRKRMSFTDQITEILEMKKKWPNTSAIYIEKGANGHAAKDHLEKAHKISGIVPVSVEGKSKEVRLELVQPLFNAGNVYVPSPTVAPWSQDFVAELTSFPYSDHDDQVDATSQALRKLSTDVEGEVDFMDLGVESATTIWGV